jgi:hypothetical protein
MKWASTCMCTCPSCQTVLSTFGSQYSPVATYHFQCTPQHSYEYVGEPQLILRTTIIGQLHEIRKRVLFKDKGELLVVA